MTTLCPKDMASSSRLPAILVASIFAIMVLSPFAPTTSASSEEYEDPIAFLPGWDVSSSAVALNGYSHDYSCLLYTSPSPRDATLSRMPSSA